MPELPEVETVRRDLEKRVIGRTITSCWISPDAPRWTRSSRAAPLVVAQIAVSLILLAGAGLALRSLHRLESVEPGFETERTLTLHLDLDWHRYRSGSDIRAFHSKLLSELKAMPGVSTAALGRSVPLSISQEFQRFTGTAGEDARIEQGRLEGPSIRFIANLGRGRRVYEGRVEGDRMTGTGTGASWSAARAQP